MIRILASDGMEKGAITALEAKGCQVDQQFYDPEALKDAVKKYDVLVYRRNGHYTMHRIVKVTRKGYVICGDNRTHLERDITDKDIIGVLYAFYHDGRLIKCTDEDYIKYSKKVCKNLPLRIIKTSAKQIFGKLYKIVRK